MQINEDAIPEGAIAWWRSMTPTERATFLHWLWKSQGEPSPVERPILKPGRKPVQVAPGSFGWRLRGLRMAADLTQRELAEAAGVSHNAIAKYERGDMYPTSSALVHLGRALNVSIDFLMLGSEEHRIQPTIENEA